MRKAVESKLKAICKWYLIDSRAGDWEHTLRVVKWMKYLIEHEGGDESVLIPTAYLHDIGWSVILPSSMKKQQIEIENAKEYLDLHMKKGAELSKQILLSLNYPVNYIERITSLVSIHDCPEKLERKDEILLMEADRLDRFGKSGVERIKAMIKPKDWVNTFNLIKSQSKSWFRTKTGIKAYERLLKEMEKELDMNLTAYVMGAGGGI